MMTNQEKMEASYEEPYLLITDKSISSVKEIVPVLEAVASEGKPLVIIAEDVEGEALTMLVLNILRGALKVCAVKAPGFGDEKRELLEDIAILSGGRVIAKDKDDKLEDVSLEDLGSAKKIKVDKETTVIIEGKGDKKRIEQRIKQLEAQAMQETSEFRQEDLRKRLGKLSGGVAVVNVGAPTETELKEKKMRIDDALHATKAAIEEGVVPGGGITLVQALKELDKLVLVGDSGVGVRIVKRALEGPTRQIAFNAGKDGSDVLATLKDKPSTYGYNAKTDKYEDLITAGVIDPTKVVRNALQAAASITAMVITTEGIVADFDDEKDKPGPAIII
jgi:chaperonin GroEL